MNPQEYPDFWEQMKGFTDFLKDVGQDVSEGHGIFVTEEKQKERLETCGQCEHFDQNQRRCYLCGCFMEHKIKFKSSSCPDSRW